MSQSSQDSRPKDRVEQLNVIIARRNELLRDLFRLIHNKEDFTTLLHGTDEQEDNNFQLFLKRFDLSADLENNTITNLKEEEFPFLTEMSSATAPTSSTRTTRSRSRAELITSPSLTKERFYDDTLKINTSFKHTEDVETATPNDALIASRKIKVVGKNNDEDNDELNDELDLIDSPSFSVEGNTKLSRPMHLTKSSEASENALVDGESMGSPSPSVRLSNTFEEVFSDGKAVFQETNPESLKRKESDHPLPIVRPGSTVNTEMENVQTAKRSQNPDDGITQQQSDSASRESEGSSKSEKDIEKFPAVVNGEGTVNPKYVFPLTDKGTSASIEALKRVPIHIPLPPSIHPDILIPTPAIRTEEPSYNLNDNAAPGVEVKPSKPAVQEYSPNFDPQYTLPPLSMLPPDFNKKTKSTKRRKDKDSKKEETVPLGLNKWSAVLKVNPVWTKVAQSSKCLSTREWGIAMTELRLIRTFERIEYLKDNGQWSFRQPKKQRNIGGLYKTHWDYLLDEMKWMRIDFREERKWKLALGYNLSTAVLEWHALETPEKRQRAGICVKWRIPDSNLHEGEDMVLSTSQDEEPSEQPNLSLGITYDSDDDIQDEQSAQDVIDPLEPSKAMEDALEVANDIQPKSEEADDQSTMDFLRQMPTDGDQNVENAFSRLSSSVLPDGGLKNSSNNPILSEAKSSSQSTNGDTEPPPVPTKPSKSVNNPLRQQIVYQGDELLFADLNALQKKQGADSTSNLAEDNDVLDLQLLFPDLLPLGLLELPQPPVVADGKKKSEKRLDKDDPNRRIDDTAYTKLYPTGRFMLTKPTLIGPLQPAKQWKNGEWNLTDQTPVLPESDNTTRSIENLSNELFEVKVIDPASVRPPIAKEKEEKRPQFNWTPEDDILLKSLCDQYSLNWPLIADSFNAIRKSTPADKRGPTDCLQHWFSKWGQAERTKGITYPNNTSEDTSGSGPMTTRGLKRHNPNTTESAIGAHGAMTTEAKKRRRHLLLQDSIRKAVKKRSDMSQKALAAQRKTPAIHETHNQFNKLPKLGPVELSRMKAEKDLRESQEVLLARKRQEEQVRQTLLLREQAARGGVPVAQSQAVTAGQSQQGQQSQQQITTQQPQSAAGQSQQQSQQQTTPQPQAQGAPAQFNNQQLAQLQQLQAQQGQRPALPAAVLPARSTRLTAPAVNTRPLNPQTQAQLLQQAARLQIAGQIPTAGTPAQPTGATAAHPSGAPFYGLPPSMTQEQFMIALMQAQQHQHQQQQQSQQNLPTQNHFNSQAQ